MDIESIVTKEPAATDVALEKRTYTVMEIADLLRISKSKAYALCSMNLFHIIRIGRAVRISKPSLV